MAQQPGHTTTCNPKMHVGVKHLWPGDVTCWHLTEARMAGNDTGAAEQHAMQLLCIAALRPLARGICAVVCSVQLLMPVGGGYISDES